MEATGIVVVGMLYDALLFGISGIRLNVIVTSNHQQSSQLAWNEDYKSQKLRIPQNLLTFQAAMTLVQRCETAPGGTCERSPAKVRQYRSDEREGSGPQSQGWIRRGFGIGEPG